MDEMRVLLYLASDAEAHGEDESDIGLNARAASALATLLRTSRTYGKAFARLVFRLINAHIRKPFFAIGLIGFDPRPHDFVQNKS